MKNKIQQIHDASMKILEKVGMKILHPDAAAILKDHGIRMEGDTAYFTESEIMEWLKKAPAVAKINAVNPMYNMDIGGDNCYRDPASGPCFIMEKDGSLRKGLMADHIKYVKLYEASPYYYSQICNGAIMPDDVPVGQAQLLNNFATMVYSEKCLPAECTSYTMAMKEISYALLRARFDASVEEFKAVPRTFAKLEPLSPLVLDEPMAEGALFAAKYNQPVMIATSGMAGTTAPVTIAGTVALANAEALASIALLEMYRPGLPVIYGTTGASADMSNGAIALGSSETALIYKYTAKMAKFYGLSSKASAPVTDAQSFNAQAGYECMLNYLACRLNGINLIHQCGGITGGYLTSSYEKLIMDLEVINYAERYIRDIDVDENTLAVDVIEEVGPGGEFLSSEHTTENFRAEHSIPYISVRGPHCDGAVLFDKKIDEKIEKMLAEYKKPKIDTKTLNNMCEVLHSAGVDNQYIDLVLNND